MYGANTLAQSDIRAPLFYDGSTPNVVITIHDDGVDMKGPWRCWEGSYYGLDSSSCTGSAGMNLLFRILKQNKYVLILLRFSFYSC